MYVGIDIGGTKVDLCRFNRDYGVVSHKRIHTDTLQPGGPHFWEAFTEVVSDFVTESDQQIGIAMKGIVHEQRVVYSSLLGGEVGALLGAQLAESLGKPVRIDNDIRPLARAERRMGQALGVGAFSVVNLGTGLGVAHVDGNVLCGYASVAGQVDLLTCWVEQLGRFESFQNLISGSGVAALYREVAGEECDAQDVFLRASAGSSNAQHVVEICIHSLARFLSHVCYFYNPEAIILHGSMRHSLRGVWTRVLLEFEKATDTLSRPRAVVLSNLEHAACVGAVL